MNHTLTPVILNKDSKFVVITYWWGRGNKNKNMQRPCPEEMEEGDRILVQPPTFDKMIQRWISSCKKSKCNYLVEEYPEFAKPGNYQNAINYKPTFIEECLKACYPRSVLYIDGDMLIKTYPHIFDMVNVDYMATGWNVDPRIDWSSLSACIDPYVFETSGGIMYFNNTKTAASIIQMWKDGVKKHVGKADDRIVSMIFNVEKRLLSCNLIQLPSIEYLWFDMDYEGNLNKKNYSTIYVHHPECVTGEDRAYEYGSSTTRHPRMYDYLVSQKTQCRRRDTIYEFIYFDGDRSFLPALDKYFKFLSNKHIKLVKFDEKYGERNVVADQNREMMKQVKPLTIPSTSNIVMIVRDMKQVKKNDQDNVVYHVVKSHKRVIPTIIKYLSSGIDVLYMPETTKKRNIANIMRKVDANDELEFIARNVSKSKSKYRIGYHLVLDTSYPMYFSSKNNVLKHMLYMCRNITSIQSVFNHSTIFLSRIRCKWV